MATNAPPGDGHRNGAVRKRSQLKTKIEGQERYSERTFEPYEAPSLEFTALSMAFEFRTKSGKS